MGYTGKIEKLVMRESDNLILDSISNTYRLKNPEKFAYVKIYNFNDNGNLTSSTIKLGGYFYYRKYFYEDNQKVGYVEYNKDSCLWWSGKLRYGKRRLVESRLFANSKSIDYISKQFFSHRKLKKKEIVKWYWSYNYDPSSNYLHQKAITKYSYNSQKEVVRTIIHDKTLKYYETTEYKILEKDSLGNPIKLLITTDGWSRKIRIAEILYH